MTSLVNSLFLNAAVATALALIVWVAGLVSAVRQRPGLRHCLWCVVLLKMITPPLFLMPLSSDWNYISPTEIFSMETPSSLLMLSDPLSENLAQHYPNFSGWLRANWPGTLFFISLLGTAFLLSYSFWQVCKVRRAFLNGVMNDQRLNEIAKHAAARFQTNIVPVIMVVDANISPMLWVQIARPLIVIPRKLAEQLTKEQIAYVISHELAHYVRRDHWSNGLSLLVAAICWWNPVVWLARRELSMTQEACCDALVISLSPNGRKSYAQTLFQALEFLQSERPFEPTLGCGFGPSSSMERRFQLIANPRVSHRLTSWCLALVALAGVSLPMLPTLATPQEEIEPVSGSQREHSPAADRMIIEGVEYQRVPVQAEKLTDEEDQIDAKLDTLQSDSRLVRLNLSFDEGRRAEMKFLELFISSDRGKTWTLAAANTPDRSQFDHIVPSDGTYWFGLRVTYRNGAVSPRSLSRILPALKVRVTTAYSDFVGGLGEAVSDL